MLKLIKDYWGPNAQDDLRSYGAGIPPTHIVRRVSAFQILVLSAFLIAAVVNNGKAIVWLSHLFALNH